MSKYKVGDKVVPRTKSVGVELEDSVWKKAKDNGQKFLYVTGFKKANPNEVILLDRVKGSKVGDFFKEEDLEFYMEEEEEEELYVGYVGNSHPKPQFKAEFNKIMDKFNKVNEAIAEIHSSTTAAFDLLLKKITTLSDKVDKLTEMIEGKAKTEAIPSRNSTVALLSNTATQKYSGLTRAQIVLQAANDVHEMLRDKHLPIYDPSYDKIKFFVNPEKRTVVATLFEGWLEEDWSVAYHKKPTYRTFAKCSPEDDFNVHVGQAIALYRLFNLPVPVEYLNLPNRPEIEKGAYCAVK